MTKHKAETGKEFTGYISCVISELQLELHTRCFACRMDPDGTLQSIEGEDIEKVLQYFVL